MIYLDNAATTAVYPQVVDAIKEVYEDVYFNPSSTYGGGIKVKKIIASSREFLAEELGVSSKEIYFTSCATESNNWALNQCLRSKKGNLIISAGEHACVFETAKYLKERGVDVRVARLKSDGTVNMEHLLSLIDDSTYMASVIHVSNETGAVNPIAEIAKAVREKNPSVLIHSDGVQAFMKTDCAPKRFGVDLYSVSGHKIHAPKGIGLLYASSRVNIKPLIHGGGQENGMRSGTENVGGIVALAKACEIFKERKQQYLNLNIRNLAISLLKEKLGDDVSVFSPDNAGEFILAFSVSGIKAEIIQTMCFDCGVAIGRGSACASRHSGNRVLSEMGFSKREIDGALRLSFCPDTTKEDVKLGVNILCECVEKLRGHKIG